MKKLLSLIALIALCFTAKADVSTNKSIAMDLFTQTNLTFVVSPSYSPHLRTQDGKLDHWGVSAAALYPVTQNSGSGQAFAGYRVDYIGTRFSASTVSATYSVPVVIFNKLHLQPFADVGANIEMTGGNSGNLGLIAGAGIYGTLYTWSWGTLGAGAAYENWTLFNNTPVYRGFVSLNHQF